MARARPFFSSFFRALSSGPVTNQLEEAPERRKSPMRKGSASALQGTSPSGDSSPRFFAAVR